MTNLRMSVKFVILAYVHLNVVNEAHGLTCYRCSWSDSASDFKEYQKEKQVKRKDLKYPVAEPFIGEDLEHPPSKDEMENHCVKEPCKPADSCLTWSFVSDTPKNVTYMCVGNPNKRKGCYEQEIKGNDLKQYLKVKACLCEEDFCNKALSSHIDFSILLISLISLVFVNWIKNT